MSPSCSKYDHSSRLSDLDLEQSGSERKGELVTKEAGRSVAHQELPRHHSPEQIIEILSGVKKKMLDGIPTVGAISHTD